MSADPLATHSALPPHDQPHTMSSSSFDTRPSTSSINTLRAAASHSASASRRVDPSATSESHSSPGASTSRHMSVNTAIGVPLAKVDLGEKEEGEISEEEEEDTRQSSHLPFGRSSYHSSMESGPSRLPPPREPRSLRRSQSPVKSDYRQTVTSFYRPPTTPSFPDTHAVSAGAPGASDSRNANSPRRSQQVDREQSPQKVSSAGSGELVVRISSIDS